MYLSVSPGDLRQERLRDEDDELLQFAIQQSLIEAGSEDEQVTLWEALNKTRPAGGRVPNYQSEEERMLQRYDVWEVSCMANH